MSQRVKSTNQVSMLLQTVATMLLTVAAAAVVALSIAAAFGFAPWLNMPLTFGETTFENAGIFIQSGFGLLLVLILSFIPSGMRVLRLEHTHRDFNICMSDVADAYSACHRADRAGAFTLSSEFDSVKERIKFLRQHPDLGNLEPDVIEAAAQMSHVSRELAEIYSDENVTRARGFLQERMAEIETFRERIAEANTQCHELRRWLDQVELEEDMNTSQLQRLEEQLGDTLTELGFRRITTSRSSTPSLVSVPSATAAE